ncbi:hypothetical protein BDA96_01G410500 [Sorghum bicolor]|uniref:Uncharacterized protein n=1 Tax=Sorghum bicolor TaxID=4558 RepID=A0A921S3B3_SORBI|nr:hypothetical protein BDA96_01G410500 [Sorghum bicolor]
MPCPDAACPTAPPLHAIDAARPISTAPYAPRCLSPEVTCSSYSRGGPVLQLRLAPDSGSPSVAENAGEIPCLTLHGQAVLRAPLLQVLCFTRGLCGEQQTEQLAFEGYRRALLQPEFQWEKKTGTALTLQLLREKQWGSLELLVEDFRAYKVL